MDRNILLGIDHEEEEILLSAGDVSIIFESGRIKNISFHGICVIKEIYFALRDSNWATVPYRIEKLSVKEEEDSFRVRIKAFHDSGEMRFTWDGEIAGTSYGMVSYQFRGVAKSDFYKNRVGLCVLHPRECAGVNCTIGHVSRGTEVGRFPYFIAPYQPYTDIWSISYKLKEGTEIKVDFEGEIFEMEDQRNWSDASFKTYGTPLELPFPVLVHKGEVFEQKATIQVVSPDKPCIQNLHVEKGDFNFLEWNPQKENCMQPSGISLGSCITGLLSHCQISHFKRIKLKHIRFDYWFNDTSLNILEIINQVEALESKMLLVIHISELYETEIRSILPALTEKREVIQFIAVFRIDHEVIDSCEWMKITKLLKGVEAAIGSGTDAFFTQLNRNRLDSTGMDFVIYSNNPQVHAFDNESIMETTKGQQDNYISCKNLYSDKRVIVSPITLKMRWNPDATGAAKTNKDLSSGNTDIRQISLFGAAWTFQSICNLIKVGAEDVTFYELAGERGMMALEWVYPMYFVFAFFRNMKNKMAAVYSNEKICAILIKETFGYSFMAANLKPYSQKFTLQGAYGKGRSFMLEIETVEALGFECFKFFDQNSWTDINTNKEIDLPPYALICINFSI